VKLTTHIYMMPSLRMHEATLPLFHASSCRSTWLNTVTVLPFLQLTFSVCLLFFSFFFNVCLAYNFPREVKGFLFLSRHTHTRARTHTHTQTNKQTNTYCSIWFRICIYALLHNSVKADDV